MRKLAIIFLSSLLIYAFFRMMTFTTFFIILFSLLCMLLIAKLRATFLERIRYPLIAANLLFAIFGAIYPTLFTRPIPTFILESVSVTSLLFTYAFLNEKKGGFFRECVPFSLVYVASSMNLFFSRSLPLILPLSLSGILYFYIVMKKKQMICLCSLLAGACVFIWLFGFDLFGDLQPIFGISRSILFGASFLLFAMSFFDLVRDRYQNSLVYLTFLGMLTIALDCAISYGLYFRFGFSYKPYLATLLLILLAGIMMKEKKGVS